VLIFLLTWVTVVLSHGGPLQSFCPSLALKLRFDLMRCRVPRLVP